MKNLKPSATGISIKDNPKANMSVYSITFFSFLKMVPIYDGKRNVMQQGANKASTPARNEAVRETPIMSPESILFLYNSFNFERQFCIRWIIGIHIYFSFDKTINWHYIWSINNL